MKVGLAEKLPWRQSRGKTEENEEEEEEEEEKERTLPSSYYVCM